MEISYILLTWNSERYIQKCLQAVIDDIQCQNYSAEIFIIDNGSTDRTPAILQEFHRTYPEQIVPILLEKNTGTTYSRNLGLKRAKGQYLCVMDSDVEVTPGAIASLIRTLQNQPDAGLAAPRLIYPDGRLQKSTDVFPTVWTKLFRYFFLKVIEKRATKQEKAMEERSTAHTVEYAISAVWVFTRHVFETVGLLDERIFYAPEDVDYCLRIWKAGYRIVYNPTVSCIHHTQEISRGFKLNRATFDHIQGLLYYFKKHHYFFRRPTFAHAYWHSDKDEQ